MERVFIIGALRTPSGKLLGSLSGLTAPELAAPVIRALVERAGIKGALIDEVIMGNVISAGVGQNPARQAAILAGLPDTVAALTVNKVCASGMKAVALAASAIREREADLVVAGGMESMSNAPFLLKEFRQGKKHGDSLAVDSMIYDGLRDCYYDSHMGALCEFTASKYDITREEQDAFALESHRRAAKASDSGLFREEIMPVNSGGRTVVADETIRRETDIKSLSSLRPVFKENGTITAGNSPGLNDGAAALLLSSEQKAKELGLKPLGEVLSFSSAHTDPKWYTVAPVRSVSAILKKTGLKVGEFDLIEENEAFAAQTLAVAKELNLDRKKLNVHGGAIALGHPIGASGARILVTLVHALRERGGHLGLATLCLGGGGAMSMAVRAAAKNG